MNLSEKPIDKRLVNVLLVEDDPVDAQMTQEAFRAATMDFKFNWVDDGVKGLRYLKHDTPYEDSTRPDLILLDINLPRKDGRKVLQEIKNDDQLKSIPVVLFTTSDTHVDLIKKYALDSRCYIVKPSSFGQFSVIVRTVEDLLISDSATVVPLTLNVLLIEDDAGDEALLRELLAEERTLDIHLDWVTRLQAGMEYLRDHHPDLVLLDLELPDSQGLETFLKLRAGFPSLTTIVLTGLNDDVLALEAVRRGAQDYLVKGQITGKALGRIVRYSIERDRVRNVLQSLAVRDELTGLYNRRGFLTLVDQQIKSANRNGLNFILCLADLDGMKQINDQHGHGEGDQALKTTADILTECFRTSDIVARIGGDEFAIGAVEEPGGGAAVLQRRLGDALKKANAGNHRPYQISCSFGMARLEPQDSTTLENLMARADSALYDQKRNKKKTS